MKRFLLLFTILAAPASAQDYPVIPSIPYNENEIHFIGTNRVEWSFGASMERSYVELNGPKVPNAVATVTFLNTKVHDQDHSFSLQYNGLDVGIILDFQYLETEAEKLIVYPPSGYIAIPPEIVTNEDEQLEIHIYEWQGM